jgi:hypothetical protein
MGPAVAPGAVTVPPSVVGGQQVGEGGQQVLVAPRAGLEDRDPRGRVRDENVEQAVPAAARELCTGRGDVEDDVRAAGPELVGLRVHEAMLPAPTSG